MTDTPKESSGAAAPSEEGTFNQADIDALLNSSGGNADPVEAPAASPSQPPPADADQVSQADVDALLSAAAGELGAEGDNTSSPSAEAAPDARVDSMGRPFDEMAAAMQAAIDEDKTEEAGQPTPAVKSLELPDFAGEGLEGLDAKRVSMLSDVNLDVRIELGRTRMLVEEVLKLGEGSVVELNKLAGDPVDVFANGRLIARGEVLVLNDSFCVRISEVFSEDPHRVSQ